MHKEFKYENFLLEEAKKGNNNSFLELSEFNLNKIFQTVFALIPDIEASVKISSEIFFGVWKEVKKIKNVGEFKIFLDKVSVLHSVNYLSENKKSKHIVSIETLEDELEISFSETEKQIFQLPASERIAIILTDYLQIPEEVVNKILIKIDSPILGKTLNETRKKLLEIIASDSMKLCEKEKLKSTPENKQKAEQSDLNSNDNSQQIYNQECIDLSKNLLKNLLPYPGILENLRELIVNAGLEKKKKSNAAGFEEDIATAEELLNKKTIVRSEKTSNILFNLLRTHKKKLFFAIITLIVIIIGDIIYNNIPNFWEITNNRSNSLINGQAVNGGKLIEGDIISTKNFQMLTLKKDNYAEIKVLHNSKLKFINNGKPANEFKLYSGTLQYTSLNEPAINYSDGNYIFKLLCSNSIISTKYANFTVSTEQNNNFNLTIDKGWLSITLSNLQKNIYCCSHYSVENESSFKVIIPFYTNAPAKYKQAIKRFSISPDDNEAFTYILEKSKYEDMLTLWHLLKFSDQQNIDLILNKLNDFLLLEIDIKKMKIEHNKMLFSTILNLIKEEVFINDQF